MGSRRPFGWERFLVFAVAITSVGGTATVIGYLQSLEAVQETARARLLDTARLAALQIDPDAQAVASQDTIRGAGELDAMRAGLMRIVGSSEDVDRVYTLVRTEGGYRQVVMADSKRHSGGNFNVDQALLDQTARSVRDKAVTVETAASGARRVVVPLVGSDGTASAVMVLEANDVGMSALLGRIGGKMALTLAGVVVASLLLGGLLTMGVRSERPRVGVRSAARTRTAWIMVGLATAGAAVVTDGIFGFQEVSRAVSDSQAASSALRHLDLVNTEIQPGRPAGWVARLSDSSQFFDDAGRAWFATQIDAFTSAAVTARPELSQRRGVLARASQIERSQAQGSLLEAQSRVGQENRTQAVRLILTVVLSVCTIGLLASVHRKDRTLETVREEFDSTRESYQALIGNLPIGLFAFMDGEVVFTNGAWGTEHSRREETVLDSVHPDDRAELLRTLERAQREGGAVCSEIRVDAEGRTMHFGIHGAAIDGPIVGQRQILVFCTDISALVVAKDEVGRKNHEVSEKNLQLQAAIRQVESSLQLVLTTMVRAVELRDPYTAGHSERVRQYSVRMATHMGLSEYERRILSYGALIHDVGKIGIPDAVLLKPGALTEPEFGLVMQHPVIGARMVENIDLFKDCLPIVRWHHERLDGSGYPDGLKADEIPFLVRIVSVADAFDAMTSSRSYRAGVSCEQALETLSSEVSAGKLDAIAFSALQAVVANQGVIGDEGSTRSQTAA